MKNRNSQKKITDSLSRDKRSADTSIGLSGKISGSQEPAMPHPGKHPDLEFRLWILSVRNFSTFIARNRFVVYNQKIMSKIYG